MRSAGCAPPPASKHRRASLHTTFHNRWLCIIGLCGHTAFVDLTAGTFRSTDLQSNEAEKVSFAILRTHTPDPEETFVVTADLRQVSESSSQISSSSRAPPFGIDVNTDISLSDPLTAAASKCYALVMVESFDTISTNSTEKD